jgi:hypothetical protein
VTSVTDFNDPLALGIQHCYARDGPMDVHARILKDVRAVVVCREAFSDHPKLTPQGRPLTGPVIKGAHARTPDIPEHMGPLRIIETAPLPGGAL